MTEVDSQRKQLAAELFSPRTPINSQELFSGRYSQIQKLLAIIRQAGAHAIIYGERGVGKTSIANVAPIVYHVYTETDLENIVAPRVNCDGTDSFDALWRKVFRSVRLTMTHRPVGYVVNEITESYPFLDTLDIAQFTPGIVQEILGRLGRECRLIVTFDEFDRLPSGEVPKLMADTIKTLSDNSIQATIIIVGVGDSVSELVRGHESVGRHIVEVPLPRMSRDELERIVLARLPQLQLTISDSALKYISLVCAGLPYFTHLLGQHAVCAAIDTWQSVIEIQHVEAAMKRAIEDSEREMKTAYYSATLSRHPNNQFPNTLAACALAPHDDFGYFTAAAVREPLRTIKGRVDAPAIPDFAQHLVRFCDPEKGAILQVTGQMHQRRYRFRDPLMQPFVIIRSLADGVITLDQINEA